MAIGTDESIKDSNRDNGCQGPENIPEQQICVVKDTEAA